MLQGEIKPFADHHISELDKVHETLRVCHLSFTNPVIGMTADELAEGMKAVVNAQRALERFKVCMDDTHREKERLYQKDIQHRLSRK